MKKTVLLIVLCLLCLPSFALAQQVEIISIQGDVYTRDNENAEWQTPGVGQILNKDTEIMTGDDGKCVIAFDAERKNTVTIEKGSRIKIENIVPGGVFLPKGRVFTLIRNIGQVGQFEVKTPTAVSGARGTGWVTEFENGATSISVFEDNVLVTGLDTNGLAVSELDVQQEYQVQIPAGGAVPEPERVSESERQEWDNNVRSIDQIISDLEQKTMKEGQGAPQPMDAKKDPARGPEDQKRIQDMGGNPPMTPGGFSQYMAGEFGPRHGGGGQPYDYQGDKFFGAFDRRWDSGTGRYVQDHLPSLTEEQHNTIFQPLPPPGGGCVCPACHPDGDPAIYCPH